MQNHVHCAIVLARICSSTITVQPIIIRPNWLAILQNCDILHVQQHLVSNVAQQFVVIVGGRLK